VDLNRAVDEYGLCTIFVRVMTKIDESGNSVLTSAGEWYLAVCGRQDCVALYASVCMHIFDAVVDAVWTWSGSGSIIDKTSVGVSRRSNNGAVGFEL